MWVSVNVVLGMSERVSRSSFCIIVYFIMYEAALCAK